MNRDLLNKEFYNAYADSFDKIPFSEALIPLILRHLPASSTHLLEIGSGAGALALWMSTLGHQITCIEPAEKPAEKARQKGLNVNLMRFQDFPINGKFDSIIAISSLIHIPKLEMASQIEKIRQLLKPDGKVFVSFIEGDCECYEDPTGTGKNRFFSKFSEAELDVLLSPHFSIIELQKIEVSKMKQTFLLMALKLK